MIPTRDAGLARLAAFAPQMGSAYGAQRNHDRGPGQHRAVSHLSPWLRHRLITEVEVINAALEVHGPERSAKFVQEVLWRTYWKGWLEQHPSVWRDYRIAVETGLQEDIGEVAAASAGRTGIECFDAWAQELAHTGYLHNHARMWFASIWCFTLRLPWQAGADFFLRHLLDADAASNTLSWRWVAGLQTRGKHYVARAENIARYTDGRFNPVGQLNEAPAPLPAGPPEPLIPLPTADQPPAGPVALLLHDDDLHAESIPLERAEVIAIGGLAAPGARSPHGCAALAAAWTHTALVDGLRRGSRHFNVAAAAIDDIAAWAVNIGCADIITPWAATGWAADILADAQPVLAEHGIRLHRIRRSWDTRHWPLAKRGFFAFRHAVAL